MKLNAKATICFRGNYVGITFILQQQLLSMYSNIMKVSIPSSLTKHFAMLLPKKILDPRPISWQNQKSAINNSKLRYFFQSTFFEALTLSKDRSCWSSIRLWDRWLPIFVSFSLFLFVKLRVSKSASTSPPFFLVSWRQRWNLEWKCYAVMRND